MVQILFPDEAAKVEYKFDVVWCGAVTWEKKEKGHLCFSQCLYVRKHPAQINNTDTDSV